MTEDCNRCEGDGAMKSLTAKVDNKTDFDYKIQVLRDGPWRQYQY